MYKFNPVSVSGTSWWTPICKIPCKNWPIMKQSLNNTTSSSSAFGVVDSITDSLANRCNYTNLKDDAEADEYEFSYILALLFGIPATLIILITVFGNFLVLCFKAKVGKRQTMLLIWNLGLADFLVGLFVLPVGVSYVIGRKWPFNRLLCRIWVSCDVIFCTASIVTLCIISVDRYIGVTRPLRYKLIVTKTKVIVSIIAIWIFSISILLATIRYHPDVDECYNPNVCHAGNELEYVIHSVVFAFFLPTLVTLFLYWKIYKVAKRREKGLAQGLILAMGQNFFKDCFAVPLRIHCGRDTMSQQQQVIRMHKRVAKTLGVVVSAFVLCWGPFFSLYIIGYQCGGCIPSLILDITSWLGYCNSMINPVIYAFTVDEFKRTLKVLFCSICRRRQARRASAAQSEPIRGASGGRTTEKKTYTLYPPASSLPRSNRAYSLVPAAEEQAVSLISPFFQKKKPTAADRSTENLNQSATKLNEQQLKKDNSLLRKRQNNSRRSKKCAPAEMTTKTNDQRRHTLSSLEKKQRPQSENESGVELIVPEPPVPPTSLANGSVTSSLDPIDMDELSESDPVWSAKLYCTLISSQSTGL